MNSNLPLCRVFNLVGVRGNEPFKAVLILPGLESVLVVTAAWSYAIRYTAKGLDIPDYQAAVKLLLERHPSWQVFIGEDVGSIGYGAELADKDTPD